MNHKKTKNVISSVIFFASAVMAVFITHLLVRAGTGIGIFEPGKISAALLLVLVAFFGSVWCTIFFIGYQLHKISNDESCK